MTEQISNDAALNQANLKRSIGLFGAIGVSVNQIIGGGIVSLTGVAIAYTGGGVAWSFGIAAVTIMIVSVPYAGIGAAMPVAGGSYTWPARLIHPTVGFFNMWLFVLALASLSLYGLSAGAYLHALNPWFNQTWVAVAMIAIFYVANLGGAVISSRVGIVMLIVMVIGFLTFVAYGLSQVGWATYPPVLPNGFLKLLQAAALLTFATGGATGVAELGRELKNPGRDIPIAMIGGTGLVGMLYILIAIPAAGVLPISKVAGEPLSTVAKAFMPHGLWLFFILGGAMIALVSTMNAQLLWGTKGLLAACDDGWIPKWLGAVNKRFGTPHVLLTILFLVGLVPAVAHIDISMIGTAASAISQIFFIVILCSSLRLRYVHPDVQAAASFKLGVKTHWTFTVVGIAVALYQAYLLIGGFSAAVWIAMGAWAMIGILVFVFRHRTVKAVLAARAAANESAATQATPEMN